MTNELLDRVDSSDTLADTGALVYDLVWFKKVAKSVLMTASKEKYEPTVLKNVAINERGQLMSTDRYRLSRYTFDDVHGIVVGEPVESGKPYMLDRETLERIGRIKTLARTVGTVVIEPATNTVTVTVDFTDVITYKIDPMVNSVGFPAVERLFPDLENLKDYNEPVALGLNPKYLADGARALEGIRGNGVVRLVLTGPEKPVSMDARSDQGEVYGEVLIMTMRL